jgi:hypothetical protein
MRNDIGALGGYFELELANTGSLYHDDAIAFNSGRNSFEYILICKEYKRIHIPFFTCDVILQPLKRLKLEYDFYHIDESFKPIIRTFNEGDAILYTNYFGLNQNNIDNLLGEFKNIIIDNSQAFFDLPKKDVCTFYSPRKFFGLPDGGFVYGATEISAAQYDLDSSKDRMMHLLGRIEQDAEIDYNLYKINESKLDNQPIKLMSNITQKLLNGLNFDEIVRKRVYNFGFLHNYLKQANRLSVFIESASMTCPLIYPYWVDNGEELRDILSSNRIYTASYWPNVLQWVDKKTIEYNLTRNIVCLPIDQRLSNVELLKIIEVING